MIWNPLRKTVRIAGASLLLGATALGIAACGGGSGSADGGSETVDGFQFFLSGDANQGGGFAKMVAKYKEETGVDVEIVDVAFSDLETKLKNSAQANQLPAMARVLSIDPIWKDSLVDLSPVTANSDIMMDFAVQQDSGEVLSIPTDMTAVGMFVNKTLFDEAGVSYPKSIDETWTWDEYVEAVKEVQAKTGATYGMTMDRSSHRLKALLYEFGSEGFQPSESGDFQTNAETGKALEFFKKLHDEKFVPAAVWLAEGDGNAMFKSGDVVTYMSGSWQIADFADNITTFEWAGTYLPKQPVFATQYGNASNIVVFDGPAQQAALDFTKWLYEPENYAELSAYSGFLPAMAGIDVDYPSFGEEFDIYNQAIAETPAIVASVQQDNLRYELAGKKTEGDPLRDQTVRYLNNEQDLEATIANILKKYDEELGPLPQ